MIFGICFISIAKLKVFLGTDNILRLNSLHGFLYHERLIADGDLFKISLATPFVKITE